ncbi:glycosyl hydrolase family 18 protein [Dongshaea marina]|uniref:glycosyl hydrolase family 18 protein n=1 Tax=Dongshaea marina TaxID=2047966 RepID=UPI000D3E5F76|nr:glycosyl hydrolase family 18 protein [Dongshaea marina]
MHGQYTASAELPTSNGVSQISIAPSEFNLAKNDTIKLALDYRIYNGQIQFHLKQQRPAGVTQDSVHLTVQDTTSKTSSSLDLPWGADQNLTNIYPGHAYQFSAEDVSAPGASYSFSFDPATLTTSEQQEDYSVSLSATKHKIPTQSLALHVSGLPQDQATTLHFKATSSTAHSAQLQVQNGDYTQILSEGNYQMSADSVQGYSTQSKSITVGADQPTGFPISFNKVKNSRQLSIFWCGFSGDYCGQSVTDDVYQKATLVILAFVNSNPDGSVTADTMPTALINQWHQDGKRVLISVGGQNGHWDSIFANPTQFVQSISQIVEQNGLDGVDLDIEGYTAAPQTVSQTIDKLRHSLGESKLIVVSPENVTVYPDPSIPVPSPTQGGSPWNYFVPILKASLSEIDYVQPQMYNNGYMGVTPATSQFLVTNYLGWMNKLDYKIPDFNGVPANKLIMGYWPPPPPVEPVTMLTRQPSRVPSPPWPTNIRSRSGAS